MNEWALSVSSDCKGDKIWELNFSNVYVSFREPLNLGLPLSSVAIERAVKDTTRVALLAGSINEKNGAAMLTEMSRNTAY